MLCLHERVSCNGPLAEIYPGGCYCEHKKISLCIDSCLRMLRLLTPSIGVPRASLSIGGQLEISRITKATGISPNSAKLYMDQKYDMTSLTGPHFILISVMRHNGSCDSFATG
jgi:hypothetical protein